MTSATRLLEAMNRLNLSGYAVMKRFGLSSGSVTNWRKGLCNPRNDLLRSFSEAYGVSLSWLFTGEGEMFSTVNSKLDQDFVRKIETIKKETGIPYKDLAEKLGTYPTFLSELKAGKTSVKQEWWNIIEKEYGFIWNDLDARKEVIRLREEIYKIKKALLLINIEV